MPNEFDDLTPEQLQYLSEQAQARLTQLNGGGAGAAQKTTVRLPNGQQVSGTPQEIEAAFTAYSQQNQPQPQAVQQQQQQATTQPTKVEWNYDTFVKQFTEDPRKGLEYYNQAQYGFDPGQAVQQLYGAAVEMYKEVQRLQAAEASRQFPALQKPENREVVDKIITQNGWSRSSQSLEQAYWVAKGQGMIKEDAPKPSGNFWPQSTQVDPNQPNQQQNGAFQATVPYIPGNGGADPYSNFIDDFDAKTREVTTQDLRGMIEEVAARNFSAQR